MDHFQDATKKTLVRFCLDLSALVRQVPFMAYTKLFSSIITSTIWSEDLETKVVWITMLAMCDKNGEVSGSIPGIGRIAGVPVESARAAINKFLSPDPDSRTKDDEGRRIEVIDGGWRLLNHKKYREMASKEELLERDRERKERQRAQEKRNGKKSEFVRDSSAPVRSPSEVVLENSADTDAYTQSEAEAEENTPEPQQAACSPRTRKEKESIPVRKRSEPNDERFNAFWELYPNKIAKLEASKAWKKINPSTSTFNAIMHGLALWNASIPWEDPKFIPHPATWLRGERWTDAPMPKKVAMPTPESKDPAGWREFLTTQGHGYKPYPTSPEFLRIKFNDATRNS